MSDCRAPHTFAILLLAAALTAAPAQADSRAHERIRKTNADLATHLRPDPDSFRTLGKIPPGSDVRIDDMRVIQLGKFKENWYLVTYEDMTGWVRGDDLEGESAEKQFSMTYQAPELPGTQNPGGVAF